MAQATLIQGCEVYDGSGSDPIVRDVRIREGKIADIGALTPTPDEQVLDAHGLSLMPGIIQLSSDLDATGRIADVALEREYAASGITTMTVGVGGTSFAPYHHPSTTPPQHGGWKTMRAMLDHLSQTQHAVNVAHLVGSDALLAHDAPALALNEALRAGAFGCSFSSGDPFVVGSPEYALAHTTAQAQRAVFWRPPLYHTLARACEHATMFASSHASPVVADDVLLAAHAPHSLLQSLISSLTHAQEKLYALIRHTTTEILPLSHFSITHKALAERMHHDTLTPEERALLHDAYEDLIAWIGTTTITATQKHSSLIARSLEDIAQEWGVSPSSALALLSYHHQGGVALSITPHALLPSLILQHEHALPRSSWNPFTKIWKSLTRRTADEHFASLFSHATTPQERAHIIHKLTLIPARILSLNTRGRIMKGGEADLILFDTRALAHASQKNVIHRVFIHGECLYAEGRHQYPTPGRVLFAS